MSEPKLYRVQVDPSKYAPKGTPSKALIVVEVWARSEYEARTQIESIYGRDANKSPIIPVSMFSPKF